MSGPRPVRAPRGTELSALGWQQEAALRMLQNNLDPEVAEHPDKLVVYGGTGKAARDWRSFDAMVRTLRTLKQDETMLVQSGRPVGVMQTHEWAPRVLIANSNLVGDWANWEEFRRLEALGLTMYGQMTMRLLDLHRHPGHPPGHLRDLRRRRRQEVQRHARGHHHPDRGPRRHGRRPAARRDDERRRRDLYRRRPARHRAPHRAPLPRREGRLPGARPPARRRGPRPAQAALHRSPGQRRRAAAPHARRERPHRHRDRPDLGPRPAGLPPHRHRLRRHGRRGRQGPGGLHHPRP